MRVRALLSAILVGATVFLPTMPAPSAIVTRAEATVYVTRTGHKYHRDGCRSLSKSKIPMKLSDAQKSFTACKVCRP